MHGTKTQVEVITSVQRRRRWSGDEKQRIVAESAAPGCTVSQVARRHGIWPNQLFNWRREFLAAALAEDASDGFVPVRVAKPATEAPRAAAADCSIEIVLPGGAVVRVGPAVETEALRRVLAALSGR